MNTYFKYLRMFVLAAILVNFAACEDEEEGLDDKISLQVISNGDFGDILVNKDNKTLYFFASDVNGESACNSAGCVAKWPPLLGEVADLKFTAALDEDDFGSITRGDGQKQITYKGWPLYYFSPNSDAVLETSAAITGDGAGGAFFVAKPDYTVMLGKQSVEEGEDPIVYLVDAWGITLYDFSDDDENDSNCSGGCAGAWPPLNAEGDAIVPSALSAEDFEIIEREDALGDQLTFFGRPLYYFTTDDNVRGNVLGQGGGNKFFVVEPIL